jgi:hypothetical protein
MESPYCLFSTPPGDWRTDVFALQSIRMAALYNVVIRTLNSIIHHAHIINEPEVPGLMAYCCNLVCSASHEQSWQGTYNSLTKLYPLGYFYQIPRYG